MDNELETLKLLLLLQLNVLSLYIAWHFEYSKKRLNRHWLVRPINTRRRFLGHYYTLFQEIKEDPNLFFSMTRMTVETFNYLLHNLSPYLIKKKSNICPEQRLAITLRYLSSGESIVNIAMDYRIGQSTCYIIIKNTCEVIFKVLSPAYLRVPNEQEWKSISVGFLTEWNFPNCCGAIDGKHVQMKAPPNSRSLYFNYKKTYSIVLLAVCNHKYEFTLFDVGALGCESDGGVFTRSEIGKALRHKTLNLPQESKALPGTNIKVPYYFVGDEAFEMSPNLMRPFSGRNLEEKQSIFNYRLSRGRRIIENSFGILVARWRFILKPIGFHPDVVTKCVLASISLHNFLLQSNSDRRDLYCPAGFVDDESTFPSNENGEWRELLQENLLNFDSIDFQQEVINAHSIRDTLTDYFITPEGEVSWQYDYVHRGSYQDI